MLIYIYYFIKPQKLPNYNHDLQHLIQIQFSQKQK